MAQNGNKNFQRIGIMGGAFDPIHYGHLVTAEIARSKFKLDMVVFVPSGHPPHKRNLPGHAEQRLMMTMLATVTNPHFQVSCAELDRQGLSYTYDTLVEFRELYGDHCEFFFITGADAVLEMFTWRYAERLVEMCTFIAATRPGYRLADVHRLPDDFNPKIELMQVPALSISSTDIRRRINEGEPIKYLLPEAVETYIYKQGLYQNAGECS
ncbi:MAG: nicotinate-nucleotide adenylyltransferase [Clostridiales bacterium]|nr:nicotinate-nucleotide adenylyltransferase [Clostridiales bacterium]